MHTLWPHLTCPYSHLSPVPQLAVLVRIREPCLRHSSDTVKCHDSTIRPDDVGRRAFTFRIQKKHTTIEVHHVFL